MDWEIHKAVARKLVMPILTFLGVMLGFFVFALIAIVLAAKFTLWSSLLFVGLCGLGLAYYFFYQDELIARGRKR